MENRNHLNSLKKIVKLGFLYEKTPISHILTGRLGLHEEVSPSLLCDTTPSEVSGPHMGQEPESTEEGLEGSSKVLFLF